MGRRGPSHAVKAKLPFDPRRLDGVVPSHAHIDRSGRLPLLVRHEAQVRQGQPIWRMDQPMSLVTGLGKEFGLSKQALESLERKTMDQICHCGFWVVASGRSHCTIS